MISRRLAPIGSSFLLAVTRRPRDLISILAVALLVPDFSGLEMALGDLAGDGRLIYPQILRCLDGGHCSAPLNPDRSLTLAEPFRLIR